MVTPTAKAIIIEPEFYVCAVCKIETEYMEFSVENSTANTQRRVSVCSKKCFLQYRRLISSVKKLFTAVEIKQPRG